MQVEVVRSPPVKCRTPRVLMPLQASVRELAGPRLTPRDIPLFDERGSLHQVGSQQ